MSKSGFVIAECQKTRFVRLLELAAEKLKSGGEALATTGGTTAATARTAAGDQAES